MPVGARWHLATRFLLAGGVCGVLGPHWELVEAVVAGASPKSDEGRVWTAGSGL